MINHRTKQQREKKITKHLSRKSMHILKIFLFHISLQEIIIAHAVHIPLQKIKVKSSHFLFWYLRNFRLCLSHTHTHVYILNFDNDNYEMRLNLFASDTLRFKVYSSEENI